LGSFAAFLDVDRPRSDYKRRIVKELRENNSSFSNIPHVSQYFIQYADCKDGADCVEANGDVRGAGVQASAAPADEPIARRLTDRMVLRTDPAAGPSSRGREPDELR
jgi:hypothetical protein